MGEMLIKILADYLVIPIVLIGAYTLLFKLRPGSRYHAYTRVLMSGLTAYLVAKIIASIFQPELERPFEILGTQAGASYLNNPGFPSDHVLFCTAITLAVWFETKQKYIASALLLMTVLVALGRVLALVHTPLDVAGGAVIAAIGALWYVQRPHEKPLVPRKQWSKPGSHGKVT